MHNENGYFVIFQDPLRKLDTILSSKQVCEQGIFLKLNAYQSILYHHFHEVQDNSIQSYQRLCDELQGQGVPDLQEAIKELVLQPIQDPLHQILNPAYISYLQSVQILEVAEKLPENTLQEARHKLTDLVEGLCVFYNYAQPGSDITSIFLLQFNFILSLQVSQQYFLFPNSKIIQALLQDIQEKQPIDLSVLVTWAFLHNIGKITDPQDDGALSLSRFDEWRVYKIFSSLCAQLHKDEKQTHQLSILIRILIAQQDWVKKSPTSLLNTWFADSDIQSYLGINRFQDILWYNQDAYKDLLWWLNTINVIQTMTNPELDESAKLGYLLSGYEIIQVLRKAGERSEYQLNNLLNLITEQLSPDKKRTVQGGE